MSNLNSIASLAMLQVNMHYQNRDYIDYLCPFVEHILGKFEPSPVVDDDIARMIADEFGLRIPNRAIAIVIGRMTKKGFLKKEDHRFYIAKSIPQSNIAERKAEAYLRIESVIVSFISYAKENFDRDYDTDTASDALAQFLADFSVDCLRTYLFRTALPQVRDKNKKDKYCVSSFVQQAYNSAPMDFDSFMVMVKGHMLANALLCPDLDSLTKSFSGVDFYIDTPLITKLLKLEGEECFNAEIQLLSLLKKLGARVKIFDHTRSEVHGVILANEHALRDGRGHGRIYSELRARNFKPVDLEVERNRLDLSLAELGIIIEPKPEYSDSTHEFQISESDLEEAIKDEVIYNERALKNDIASIRSIYVLRRGTHPVRLEDATAVFVTSNSALARASYFYGRGFESTKDVSSVITDFSLANIAWLKRPLDAPDLPQKEVLANCYAALSPTNAYWEMYASTIQKLTSQGRLTAIDHQMLRASWTIHRELMNMTCGDETDLKPQLIENLLEDIKAEISKDARLEIETSKKREGELRKSLEIVQNRAATISKTLGVVVSIICALIMLVAYVIFSIGTSLFLSKSKILPLPIWDVFVYTFSAMGLAITVLGGISGFTIKRAYDGIYSYVYKKATTFLLGAKNE